MFGTSLGWRRLRIPLRHSPQSRGPHRRSQRPTAQLVPQMPGSNLKQLWINCALPEPILAALHSPYKPLLQPALREPSLTASGVSPHAPIGRNRGFVRLQRHPLAPLAYRLGNNLGEYLRVSLGLLRFDGLNNWIANLLYDLWQQDLCKTSRNLLRPLGRCVAPCR
ncbi:hypothetical protein D3C81_1436830 [compost metagenome]